VEPQMAQHRAVVLERIKPLILAYWKHHNSKTCP
jgi:hypothetical protein